MAKPQPLRPVPKQAEPLKKKTENAVESPKISEELKTEKVEKVTKATDILYKKSQVEEGIRTLKKLLDNPGEKKQLFESEGEKISLQISGIKLPRINDSQIIKIRMPHSPQPESRDVCLIVKDLQKGIKADHEPTVQHFQQILAQNGVDQITQVMSLRELKVEYKQFEAKTQLCQRFDLFLADARIIRLLPQCLGKPFYKRKKLPIQVDLTAKDLKGEITRAVSTVTLPLQHTGSCASVSLGYSTLSTQQIIDNTLTVLDKLATKYPGGWPNIRSVHVKAPSTPSLPLYVTLRSANDLGKVESVNPPKTKRKTVSDELSTVPGATVTVTPYGSVRVKRKADPNWDLDNEEPIVEEEKEGSEEEKENNKEVKEKVKEKKEKKAKKEETVESDSEDEIENAELEYMKKVAEEEEEMEKKLGNNEDQEEVKDKSGDEESDVSEEEEEEAADDDTEAVNLLGEDEDESEENETDSDEELNMKNQPDFYSEPESVEEEPQKKKKSKKVKAKPEKKGKIEKPSASKSSKKSDKQKKFTQKKKNDKQTNLKKKKQKH